MSDEDYMRAAIELAREAGANDEVPVGAVVVKDGLVIGVGHNSPVMRHDPCAHAEVLALQAAAGTTQNYRLEGCELFVTLEPCAMCAGAISHARIGRVVWGAEDPKGGAVIHGPRLFEQPTLHWRPTIEGGVLAGEAADLLRGFFRARRGAGVTADRTTEQG